MTRLRLPSIPLGLGELMLFGWLLVAIRLAVWDCHSLNPLQKLLLTFWVPLAVLLALGAVWAYAHGVSSPGAARDPFALAFAAIFSVILARVLGPVIDAPLAIRWTVGMLSVYLGTLALVHLFAPDLVTHARFGTRLTGLTANPNQLAMYLAPLPFLATYLLASAKTDRSRGALLAAIALQLLAGTAVASDSLALAWLAGALGSIFALWSLRRRRGPNARDRLVVLVLIAILTVAANSLAKRYTVPEDLHADLSAALDGIGSGPAESAEIVDWEKIQVRTRAALWRSGLEVISMSPLVGYGPGRHAGNGIPFQGDEVHNSFLDLATMAGIPAGILLAWLLWSVASPRLRLGPDGYAACVIIVAVAAFASFHFMVRQPIFWFYVVLADVLRRSDA